MTTKITTLAEFEEKAHALLEKMSVINALFREADELVKSVDYDTITEGDEEASDTLYELAHDIAYTGGYEFDNFKSGYWLPSTC